MVISHQDRHQAVATSLVIDKLDALCTWFLSLRVVFLYQLGFY